MQREDLNGDRDHTAQPAACGALPCGSGRVASVLAELPGNRSKRGNKMTMWCAFPGGKTASPDSHLLLLSMAMKDLDATRGTEGGSSGPDPGGPECCVGRCSGHWGQWTEASPEPARFFF